MKEVTYLALVSLPATLVSGALSLLLHHRLYNETASSFARLRGGPAIGMFLFAVTSLIKLALIHELWPAKSSMERNLSGLFSMLWGGAEVIAGTFIADLIRGLSD